MAIKAPERATGDTGEVGPLRALRCRCVSAVASSRVSHLSASVLALSAGGNM